MSLRTVLLEIFKIFLDGMTPTDVKESLFNLIVDSMFKDIVSGINQVCKFWYVYSP